MPKVELVKVNARVLSFVDSETGSSFYRNREVMRDLACLFKE